MVMMKLPMGLKLAIPAALLVLLGAVFFWFRAPLVIVTDASFDALYGPERAQQRRLALQLHLGRRVLTALLSENAGAEQAVIAVEVVSAAPYAVFFPFRYTEGAMRFREASPETPVFIIGGRPGEGEIPVIATDTVQDCYRAGLFAAAFAAHDEQKQEVFVIQGNAWTAADRDAFEKGLRERGFETAPGYLSDMEPGDTNSRNAACVVIAGAAPRLFSGGSDIPAILFSWLDPVFSPRCVNVIFDDSPWALAKGTIGAPPEGASLPSEVLFPQDRVRSKALLAELKRLSRQRY